MNLARAAAAAALLVLPFSLGVTTPANAAVPAGNGEGHGNGGVNDGGMWGTIQTVAILINQRVRSNPGWHDPTDPGYATFTSYPDCPGNTPEKFTMDVCAGATAKCVGQNGSQNFASVVAGQLIRNGQWVIIESTCDPMGLITAFTGGSAVTQLEIAQIMNQFSFATPNGTLTPAGNTTLVTLPAYFQMSWGPGTQPGQTQAMTFAGHTLELRARLLSLNYDFGDGTSSGPTTSFGGPYPTGDITHAYTQPGAYTPKVTATWTADFRLDGGAWTAAQGSTRRVGTFPALTVVTATSRLESDSQGL